VFGILWRIAMRFVRVAIVALVLGVFQLACGWRMSLLGVTADLLFVLAAFATIRLRAAEGPMVACCIGLLADLLLGGCLGLMGIGFGLGSLVVEGLHPVLLSVRGRGTSGAPWRADILGRAGRLFVLVLVGAAAAHGTVALLGAFLSPDAGAVPGRLARAMEIAFLTGIVTPVAWPVLRVILGQLSASPASRSVVEA
jgi:hypothetical protein